MGHCTVAHVMALAAVAQRPTQRAKATSAAALSAQLQPYARAAVTSAAQALLPTEILLDRELQRQAAMAGVLVEHFQCAAAHAVCRKSVEGFVYEGTRWAHEAAAEWLRDRAAVLRDIGARMQRDEIFSIKASHFGSAQYRELLAQRTEAKLIAGALIEADARG